MSRLSLTLTLSLDIEDLPASERLAVAADLDLEPTDLATLRQTTTVQLINAIVKAMVSDNQHALIWAPADLFVHVTSARVLAEETKFAGGALG